MSKKYFKGAELLEVDGNKVGAHLAWLLRTIITNNLPPEGINSIIYNDDCPKDVWGIFHGPAKSITINIEQHLVTLISHMQDNRYMNTSLKVILIHELIDTAIHEAHHAIECLKTGSWEKGDLDEEGAIEKATDISWEVAEYLDVNIKYFGTYIDDYLTDLYQNFKKDVQEVNCKEWKKLQFHMMENNINYYNPEKGLELRTIREVFEAQVQPEEDWCCTNDSNYHKFNAVSINSTKEASTAPIEPVAPVAEPTTTNTNVPVAPVAPIASTMLTTFPEDYDPLDDIYTKITTEDDDYTSTTITPINLSQTPAQTSIPSNTTVPAMDVQRIQNIAEQVLRRMFHHVFTKCEPNTTGNFNNINAVLEPISIADIDGAAELFVKQDTISSTGKFTSHANINGMIKGLPTAGHLPRYTFYLNIGGKLHKRIFIAQNPAKTDSSGQPTSWARDVMSGAKIMMLVADGTGITAFTKLPAGQPLGQEKFKICNKKK